MLIYFVRHGQSNGNVNFVPGVPRPKSDPLTELGITQAENAADYLRSRKTKPELIISSPYTRALDTALAIQNALHVPLEQDDRLAEYDPGDWEGIHIDDFVKKFNEISADERYAYRPPNGESWLDEANRMNQVIAEAETAGKSCIVIVSHYDPIKAIINLLTEQITSNWGNPANYPTGSVTSLTKNSSGWSII